MSPYRPDGWVNPYKDNPPNSWEGLCFEAGADAVLEALREQGNRVQITSGGFAAQNGLHLPEQGEYVTMVFIPDDKEVS